MRHFVLYGNDALSPLFHQGDLICINGQPYGVEQMVRKTLSSVLLSPIVLTPVDAREMAATPYTFSVEYFNEADDIRDAIPDDSSLSWEAWNAKVDQLLQDMPQCGKDAPGGTAHDPSERSRPRSLKPTPRQPPGNRLCG